MSRRTISFCIVSSSSNSQTVEKEVAELLIVSGQRTVNSLLAVVRNGYQHTC